MRFNFIFLYFIFLNLICNQAAFAEVSSLIELQNAWAPSNFTNPQQHKNNNYTYLIHASAQIEFYNVVVPKRQLSDLGRLSSSIINQNHVGTFRNAGVILSIPQENFIAANDEDMGGCSADDDLSTLKTCFDRRYEMWGLPPPSEILKRTMQKDVTAWNEVFVSESPLAIQNPKITGLFVRVDSFDNCLAEVKLCRHLKKMSMKYHLPLVKIPPPQDEIWLIGYPKGGHTETSFGYFFRNPPFDGLILKITKNSYRKLERKALELGKKLYITTSEFTYGATPIGKVIGNSFYHITSLSSFKTIMRTSTDKDYIYSNTATPIFFIP